MTFKILSLDYIKSILLWLSSLIVRQRQVSGLWRNLHRIWTDAWHSLYRGHWQGKARQGKAIAQTTQHPTDPNKIYYLDISKLHQNHICLTDSIFTHLCIELTTIRAWSSFKLDCFKLDLWDQFALAISSLEIKVISSI